MGLSDFIKRAMEKKKADLAARAERAGAAGVEAARKVVPVRTGRLRDSIGFTWRQSDMVLTLHADAPYAALIERRKPYMKYGRAVMSTTFRGGTSEVQFATLPEKYHEAAKARKVRHVIIGHRPRGRGR